MDGETLIVSAPLCPLYEEPRPDAQRVDEVFCGWPLILLEDGPDLWCRVRTHYGYEGFVLRSQLTTGGDWRSRPLQVVRGFFADVTAAPQVEAPCWPPCPVGL